MQVDINAHEFMEQWRVELLAASDAQNEDLNETAAWLGISMPSYYRRRRGDMPFTAYEFVLLSQKFGLSMLPQSDRVPRFGFDAPLKADKDFNEERYLSLLEASVAHFGEPTKTEVLVSTTDIPIFYLFAEPNLAALKRYLFGLAIDAKGARRFDLSACRKNHSTFIGKTAAVSRVFHTTSREEAWGPNPLRSLTYQILLLVESAAISEEDCMELFDSIKRVLDRLERMLTGEEAQTGPLKLWQNRLHATSSIIQVQGPTAQQLFVTFDNPNFFATSDGHAIDYFSNHFEALRRRSILITGHGSNSPARYVQQLRDFVRKSRKKAQLLFTDLDEEL